MNISPLPDKCFANIFSQPEACLFILLWDLLKISFNFDETAVIKTVCCWCEDRQINLWNRIESQEMDPQLFGTLIINRGTKTIQT